MSFSKLLTAAQTATVCYVCESMCEWDTEMTVILRVSFWLIFYPRHFTNEIAIKTRWAVGNVVEQASSVCAESNSQPAQCQCQMDKCHSLVDDNDKRKTTSVTFSHVHFRSRLAADWRTEPKQHIHAQLMRASGVQWAMSDAHAVESVAMTFFFMHDTQRNILTQINIYHHRQQSSTFHSNMQLWCRFNFYHRVYLVGVCICVWNAVVSLTRHFSTNFCTFRSHCLIIIHGCLSSSCTVKREYRSTTWLAGLHRSIWLNPHSRANCPPNTVDGCGSLTSVAGQSMRSFMLKHC